MQWDQEGREIPPWGDDREGSGHRVIVSRRAPPEEIQRISINLQGVAKFKYMISCKHHDCPGPSDKSTLYLAVILAGKIRHEVEEALGVFLGENFPGDCPAIPAQHPIPSYRNGDTLPCAPEPGHDQRKDSGGGCGYGRARGGGAAADDSNGICGWGRGTG